MDLAVFQLCKGYFGGTLWAPLYQFTVLLLKCHSLSQYYCWPHPSIYDHSVPTFWLKHTISQSSNELKLVSWTWTWIHCVRITFTVTRSQSIRCGGMGNLHQECAADKSAVMPSGTKSLRNVFSIFLNLLHKEWRNFRMQNQAQNNTSSL